MSALYAKFRLKLTGRRDIQEFHSRPRRYFPGEGSDRGADGSG